MDPEPGGRKTHHMDHADPAPDSDPQHWLFELLFALFIIPFYSTYCTVDFADSGRGFGEEALRGQSAAQPETEVEAEAHGGIPPHGHRELQRRVPGLCGKHLCLQVF